MYNFLIHCDCSGYLGPSCLPDGPETCGQCGQPITIYRIARWEDHGPAVAVAFHGDPEPATFTNRAQADREAGG